MSIFKCKMCGGTIEFNPGDTIGVCDSCGTKQTLPRLDSDRKANLYDRANHFRRNNEFDKAMGIYETILNEDPTDAEAYWSIVLCRYGIEYVEDPATRRRVPTVNRAQYTSIFADEDYKAALQHGDMFQRQIYEAEAKAIDEIQKGILEISAKEEPFDVFICYKETDANGRRTPDSVLATDLYHQLTNEGFKVFFSRITLEDKLGQEYEPYIFAALNSAKAMVVLGTKQEYFNAVWVKNEWSRYLALIKAGAKKTLIPAYRDMDPYDLPDEFSHLQAQDMSRLGFMQDLIRGIKKIVRTDEPKQTTIRETIVQQAAQTNTAPLLRRAFMFLEDGNWQSADEYCEKVLDLEPENAQAYLGKLMAELKINKREQLKDQSLPFDDRNNYQKALRFADSKLKAELSGVVSYINDRNETARKESIYQQAQDAMERGSIWRKRALNNLTEIKTYARSYLFSDLETGDIPIIRNYKDATKLFSAIPDYKDAALKGRECIEIVENLHNERIYYYAINLMDKATAYDYHCAAKEFERIRGYKDAETKEQECLQSIAVAQKESQYKKYKQATAVEEPMDPETWLAAIDGFKSLDDYKDSKAELERCREKLYDYLVWLSEYYTTSTELSWTATLLEKLGNYKEAPEIARKCLEKKEECDREQSYSDGVKLMNSAGFSKELLTAAIQKFVFSQGWNNADKLVEICRRRIEQIMTQEEAAHLEIERRNESLRRQITVEQNRKQKYLAELADIKGLFNTKRRRELEAEIAQVEKEIDRLTADLQ